MSETEIIYIILFVGVLGCILRSRVRALKRYLLLRDFNKRHLQNSLKKTERAMSINSTYMSIVELYAITLRLLGQPMKA